MRLISKRPVATANIRGSGEHAGLRGVVRFYQLPGAILVEADIFGLPNNSAGFYGFHIHEGRNCDGKEFSGTEEHFGSGVMQHPRHAGDLPPLLSRNGYAYMAVMSDRFSIQDVLGRTVVVHKMPADLKTQPAGNAGRKIACGVICRAKK